MHNQISKKNKQMKTTKLLIAIIALTMVCGNVNAQLGGIRKAAQRGFDRAVEKTVEKRVEEKTEKVVNKAADQILGETEEQSALEERRVGRSLDRLATMLEETLEEAQKMQEEVEIEIAEVPEVGDKPYTPSASEFAFFPMKKGAVQVIATKDAKGKITSQVRNTVKEITGAKNAFAIAYESEILDEKGRANEGPLIFNYRIVVKDGIMYLDMKGLFGAMDGLDGVQVSGIAMRIPNNLAVGQKLEDASAKVKIGFINSSTTITEGECLAIEDVTVEAGTFRCYKVTQKTATSVMGRKTENTTLTWYAKGIGAVKTETYDKNGKLQSTQELISNL